MQINNCKVRLVKCGKVEVDAFLEGLLGCSVPKIMNIGSSFLIQVIED